MSSLFRLFLLLFSVALLTGCNMNTLSEATLSKEFLNRVEPVQFEEFDYLFQGKTNGYSCVIRVKASPTVIQRVLTGAKSWTERTPAEAEQRQKGSVLPLLEKGAPEWYDLQPERIYPVYFRGGENEMARRFDHYYYLDEAKNVLYIHAFGRL